MSEIDVSGCYADKKELKDGMYCFWEGKSCKQVNDCYYKQLQQLKKENEELKKGIMLECPQCGETYLNKIGCDLYEEKQKYKQCLDEIDEIAKYFHLSSIMFHKGTTHEIADRIDYYLDKIKQLIKQAKEGK